MNAILGVLFASMVGLIVFPQYARHVAESNQSVRMVATAQQQKLVYEAAAKYAEQNAGSLQSIATATTPAVVTVPMLQAVQLLNSSFSAVNPYQQTWQVQVLQPSPGYLQAFVTSVGGEALDDRQAAKIASLVGALGGFIPRNDSGSFAGGATRAYGSFGGWQLSTANYTTTGGHPAALLTLAAGQIQNNHLYRNAVPGQPQLNEMNTALGMTGNDINGVGMLRGKGGEFSRDGAGPCCGPNGQTLSLAEDTQNTGRRPSIQFHAGGAAEGYMELSGVGEPRRLNLKDNQGVGLGLNTTGTISGPRLELPNGQNLKAGAFELVNNGSDTGLRQPGQLYIEHMDGSPAAIQRVAHINASGDIITSANSWVSGTSNSGNVNTWNVAAGGDVNANGNVNVKGLITTAQQWWSMIARDGNGNDNSAQKDAAGSLYVNDIFIRSLGKWASDLNPTSSADGAYIDAFTFDTSSGWRTNGTGRTLTVQMFGGNGNYGAWNECHVAGEVAGVGRVAEARNNNNTLAKGCSTTFQVPPGANWMALSQPYPANANGRAAVYVYRN